MMRFVKSDQPEPVANGFNAFRIPGEALDDADRYRLNIKNAVTDQARGNIEPSFHGFPRLFGELPGMHEYQRRATAMSYERGQQCRFAAAAGSDQNSGAVRRH
jgi:hypothetical protein